MASSPRRGSRRDQQKPLAAWNRELQHNERRILGRVAQETHLLVQRTPAELVENHAKPVVSARDAARQAEPGEPADSRALLQQARKTPVHPGLDRGKTAPRLR